MEHSVILMKHKMNSMERFYSIVVTLGRLIRDDHWQMAVSKRALYHDSGRTIKTMSEWDKIYDKCARFEMGNRAVSLIADMRNKFENGVLRGTPVYRIWKLASVLLEYNVEQRYDTGAILCTE